MTIPPEVWVAVPGAGVVLGTIIVLKKYVLTNGKCPATDILDDARASLREHSEAARGLTGAIERNTEQTKLINETLIKVLLPKEEGHG